MNLNWFYMVVKSVTLILMGIVLVLSLTAGAFAYDLNPENYLTEFTINNENLRNC